MGAEYRFITEIDLPWCVCWCVYACVRPKSIIPFDHVWSTATNKNTQNYPTHNENTHTHGRARTYALTHIRKHTRARTHINPVPNCAPSNWYWWSGREALADALVSVCRGELSGRHGTDPIHRPPPRALAPQHSAVETAKTRSALFR